MMPSTSQASTSFKAGNDSANWAGYVSGSGNYTAIGGSWTVPAESNVLSSQANSEWIGIGGVNNRDLIQTGTEEIGHPGGVSYIAFYEILPDMPVTLPINIRPGDSITAQINEIETNQWDILLKDNTSGAIYETQVNYTSSNSSAEWIEERPLENSGFSDLTDFGTVQFTNAWTAENGSRLSLAASKPFTFTMSNAGQTLASPSAISGDSSFYVARSGSAYQSDQTQSPNTANQPIVAIAPTSIEPVQVSIYAQTIGTPAPQYRTYAYSRTVRSSYRHKVKRLRRVAARTIPATVKIRL